MSRRPARLAAQWYRFDSPATDRQPKDLWAAVAEHRVIACLAGALCLSLAQLSIFGRRAEAAMVLDVAVELVGKWEQAVGDNGTVSLGAGLTPRHETEIAASFARYRSVSHLWATVVYGAVQYRDDLLPATLQAVPRFLAYATEIARLATALQWAARHPQLELPASSPWTFDLPVTMIRKAESERRYRAITVPVSLQPLSAEAGDAQN